MILHRIWQQVMAVVLTVVLFLGSAASPAMAWPSFSASTQSNTPPTGVEDPSSDCPSSLEAVTLPFKKAVATPLPEAVRENLPLPDPKYGEGFDLDSNDDPINYIGTTYDHSCADFNMMVGPQPPEQAPNILLVLLDDVGFGASEPFGGLIHTPTLEALADEGLKYNRFHTTSLCSPTRAALLTGRNTHSAGSGTIQEQATGFPWLHRTHTPKHSNNCSDFTIPRLCYELDWQEPQCTR